MQNAHIAAKVYPDYLDDIKITSIVLAVLIAVVGDTIDMFNNKKKERQ